MAYRKRIKNTDEQKQDIWDLWKSGVSLEALYRSLYVQARGALKKELIQYHREKRTICRSRNAKPATDVRCKIPDELCRSLTWDRGGEIPDH
jgi:IS30 family transposase